MVKGWGGRVPTSLRFRVYATSTSVASIEEHIGVTTTALGSDPVTDVPVEHFRVQSRGQGVARLWDILEAPMCI